MAIYRRTELIIEYGRQEALAYARNIMDRYPVEEIMAPHLGLVMIKQRETAKNSLFYIGEVLVTQTKVRCKNHVGIGLVKGEDMAFSHALAVIDLAYKMGWPETKGLDAWLKQLEAVERQVLARKTEQTLRTKVNFSTMKV